VEQKKEKTLSRHKNRLDSLLIYLKIFFYLIIIKKMTDEIIILSNPDDNNNIKSKKYTCEFVRQILDNPSLTVGSHLLYIWADYKNSRLKCDEI
jgi:hypothetical protein